MSCGESIVGNPEPKQNNAIAISIAIANRCECEEFVCKTGSMFQLEHFHLTSDRFECLRIENVPVGTINIVRSRPDRICGRAIPSGEAFSRISTEMPLYRKNRFEN
jgi:hypothetical protein